jgi:hypothetical protein
VADKVVTVCPQCGTDPRCDEDGCCATCGSDVASVYLRDYAHDFEARIAELEKALASAQSVARTLAVMVQWWTKHFGDQIQHISMRPAPIAIKAAVETAMAYPTHEPTHEEPKP